MRRHRVSHHKAKLNPELIENIRALLAQKWKQRDLAQHFGISQSTISMINRNITWKENKLCLESGIE